jgi:ubiquinone/menaquinone biosynthesis C-methylase UbiE
LIFYYQSNTIELIDSLRRLKGEKMVTKIEPYKGIAAIYDEIRPSYPERLIQDVIAKTGLKLSDRLLEIGAGTGKATVQFGEKGFTIHAIELGEDMAEILKSKCSNYPRISLDIAAFEEWNCADNEKYDMIYSAQAFHWLDIDNKYKKCSKLLKDEGHLVLFWYNSCEDELTETKEIEQKVEEIIQKYVSNYLVQKIKPERRAHTGVSKEDERKAEIEASGLFELVDKIEYTGETRNNAQQYIKARKSVPAFASILDGLEDEIIKKMDNEIEDVINNYGGYVGMIFKFSLYIAKKVNKD